MAIKVLKKLENQSSRYSKLYLLDNKCNIRYDYKNQMIQYIENNEIIHEVGLTQESWNSKPHYWIEQLSNEVDKIVN